MRLLTGVRSAALLAGLVSGAASTGWAQLRAGIKGGFNSSNASLKVDDVEVDTKSKSGFHVGGVFYVGFSREAGLQIEGLYTKKGFKLADPAEDAEGPFFDTEWQFTYWEFPVLLMATTPTQFTQPRVFFGPTVAFQSQCSKTVDDGETVLDLPCAPGETKSPDIGFMAGIGIKATSLTVEIAYEWGFTDVVDAEAVSLKNRNLTISLGIVVPN